MQTVIDDVKKAKRLTVSPPDWDESCIWRRDPSGRFTSLFPTLAEVAEFARKARGYDLAVDTETTGASPLDCRLICVGFASANGSAICVPFIRQGGSSYWSPSEGPQAWEIVCRLLADSLTPKVFHNGAFDKLVLETYGAVVDYFADTMQATHCVDSELPMGLGFVSTRHLDIAYWKDDVKGAERWLDLADEILRSYNLRDCLSTLRLKPILENEVQRLGIWNLYQEEIALCKLMTRATRRGLLLDIERRDSTTINPDTGKPIGLAPRLILQRDDALVRLREIAGSPSFDPNKPEHSRYLIYDQLKLPVLKETKSGLPSTDKDAMVLVALAANTAQQKAAIGALADFKAAQKKLSTWTGEWKFNKKGEWGHWGGLPMGPDGRLHPSWKLLPNTGRFASSPNAQNWDKTIKELFWAGRGRKYVGVDLSQAELRFIGYTANDKMILKMYEENIDVHTVNMALYFNVRYADGHEQANAKTVAYLREICPQVNRREYDSLPVLPKHREKPVRTLVKNAEFGCLAADTPVATLSGSKPISQMQTGDWTWCWDGVKYAPTKVVRAWSTGVKPCVRVTVVDGAGKHKQIVLTGDHKMLMRDGTYKAAETLVAGERLMPFRRWQTGPGYSVLDPTNDGAEVYEHRYLMPGSDVVHHRNEIKTDNRFENLQQMTHTEHRHEHGPAVISEAGLARRSATAKQQWAEDPNGMNARLTAARVASPVWRAAIPARIAKAVETRKKNKKPKPPCSICGVPGLAKSLCSTHYNEQYKANNPNWWRKYRKKKPVTENHKVVSIEPWGETEVWDLEVEHAAHNFALDKCVFVSNSNYRAMAETVHTVLRAKRDPDTNQLLFPDLPLAQVEAILAQKMRVRTDLVRWWAENQRATERRGYLQCPISGRMRHFRGGFKITEVANWGIQAGIASWMNRCMLEIQATYDRETGGDCLVVQQVHDALNVDAHDDYTKRAGVVMEEVLGREFALPGHPRARLPPDPAKIAAYLDKV